MKKIYLISFVIMLLISSCNGVQDKQEQDMTRNSNKQIQNQVFNNQDTQDIKQDTQDIKEVELSDDEVQMLDNLLNF